VCAAAPWSRTLVRIALSEDLPRRDPSPLAAPPYWALVLASGARCTFISGATAVVRGFRLNYGCDDGRVLFGSRAGRRAPGGSGSPATGPGAVCGSRRSARRGGDRAAAGGHPLTRRV